MACKSLWILALVLIFVGLWGCSRRDTPLPKVPAGRPQPDPPRDRTGLAPRRRTPGPPVENQRARQRDTGGTPTPGVKGANGAGPVQGASPAGAFQCRTRSVQYWSTNRGEIGGDKAIAKLKVRRADAAALLPHRVGNPAEQALGAWVGSCGSGSRPAVIDVGANTGQDVAYWASTFGAPRGCNLTTIFLVEASPPTMERLREKARRLFPPQQLHVLVAAAMSNTTGTVAFTLGTNSMVGNNDLADQVTVVKSKRAAQFFNVTHVPVTTVDHMVLEHGITSIPFLKALPLPPPHQPAQNRRHRKPPRNPQHPTRVGSEGCSGGKGGGEGYGMA